mgnify:CR=1 FL=1
MCKIYVIGTDGGPLTEGQRRLLANCGLIVAARRFAPVAAELGLPFHDISPLAAAIDVLRRQTGDGKVAVLVGGDPLYYGIGKRLLAEFDHERLHFFPATTALQRACALFRMPWDDAVVTSLHGRSYRHLPGLLLRHGKNLLFTDPSNTPDGIARTLLAYLDLIGEKELARDIAVLVAEELGQPGEAIFRGDLAATAGRSFAALNVLALLVPGGEPPACRFGLVEEELSHSRGLITKNEVRAATLHQLRLPRRGVLWDIGAGSGSVSIEAARLNPDLVVYAIEEKAEQLANITANIRKYRCYNVIPVSGRAPQSCAHLPEPQRIFIGGSGGNLAAIIAMAASRLAAGGLLVVNGVIAATVDTAPRLMAEDGLQVTQTTVQVTRYDGQGAIATFNPITIITGRT